MLQPIRIGRRRRLGRIYVAPVLSCVVLIIAGCEDPVDTDWFPASPVEFAEVAAGDQHTCALDEDGHAWCFGRSAMARLGFMSRAEPCTGEVCLEPVPVEGGDRFDALEAGAAHNCARDEGGVFCWGFAWWGQLGDARSVYQRCASPEAEDPLPCSIVPVPVSLGLPIADFAVGADHSCAIAEGGDAWCWGLNQFDQSGNGTGLDALTVPALVQGGHEFRSISAGTSHSCAIDASASMWCWGANPEGRLGDSTTVSSAAPVRVAGGHTWRSVDLGSAHTCGITTTNSAFCWGFGGRGRVGDNAGVSWTGPVPVWFPEHPDPPVVRISAGATHTCLITEAGLLYCFGENDRGQLGDGSGQDRLAPSLVRHGVAFRSVSAGGQHTCAIDVLDRLYCWGANDSGQLGIGGLGDRHLPEPVGGLGRTL